MTSSPPTPETDIVEAVAAAIWNINNIVKWPAALTPTEREVFYRCASAAISATLLAIREPSDSLLDAGYQASEPIDGAIAYLVVGNIWQAMLDQAIKDHTGS